MYIDAPVFDHDLVQHRAQKLPLLLEGKVLETIGYQGCKLLETTPNIDFLLSLSSYLFQKLLLAIERVELTIHESTTLLQLCHFHAATLESVQNTPPLDNCQ